MLKWNSKETSYCSNGDRMFGFGEVIPDGIIAKMGDETVDEYKAKGFLTTFVDESEKLKDERDELMEKALALGLKPHHLTGAKKLKVLIDDHHAMEELKAEAKTLGIEASDDLKFDELTKLVAEKKDVPVDIAEGTEDEPDSEV